MDVVAAQPAYIVTIPLHSHHPGIGELTGHGIVREVLVCDAKVAAKSSYGF
jgi:hypothetical protein